MVDDQYSTQPISSWDTKVLSTTFNSSRPTQNVSIIPISPTTNYVVPYSKYNSQISSQSIIDGRQIQHYQQPMLHSQGQGTFQPIQNNPSKTSKPGWCAQHLTVTRVIGLLIGLIAAGIPLAVIVTMYVQLDTSSSSNTTANTATTSATVSNSMPYQCTTSGYSQISDSLHLATYYCPGCYSDFYSGWYRFTGGGTRIVPFPVSYGYCGGYYTGWFNGTPSTTLYATAIGTVCVYVGGNICTPSYSISVVPVTNCGSFYVYYLSSFTYSYTRFCTV